MKEVHGITSNLILFNGTRYYKRAYLEFFSTSGSNLDKQSSVVSASGYVSDYHRFGWLLFLALRVHAFSRFKDLVTCTNGLVSILVGYIPVPAIALLFYTCIVL